MNERMSHRGNCFEPIEAIELNIFCTGPHLLHFDVYD